MKNTFSREKRLTTDAQFKQVFRKGRKTSAAVCAVFCYFNNLTHPRLGLVVPKKSIKKAHERNIFKRAVREGFRLRQHELGAIDIVILSYKQAEGLAKEKLCLYLEKQWEELILRQKKLQSAQ
ncbi:MAG: ribonuclease P [uncultured bacterium]|nr:MAG: ribonuclease P [uncultured bacterium]